MINFENVFEIFISIYIQIYIFFNNCIIKFDEIIQIVINEKRRIFLFNINIIIFIYRINKNKEKNFVKKNFDNNNNREFYPFCKIINKKFKYFLIKY